LKADPFQIGDVLKNPRRFVVPIYQRTYAWKIKPHLETFFDQVEAKAEERLNSNQTFPHYMGALLVIPRGAYAFGQLEILDIVDGQQRLTTFEIFLAALRDLARSVNQSQIADLLTPLLLNAEGPQMRDRRTERYKLHPTSYDRGLYRDLVDLDYPGLRAKYPNAFYKNGNAKDSAPLPLSAWTFLRFESETFINASGLEKLPERLTALSAAILEDFRVIVITLGERDDALVIFETLNSGCEPLAAMDLVRNDVFHRATRAEEDVEDLMERRWSAFEDPFWKEQGTRGRIKKPRIDFFLSDTLGAETGKEILLTELYAHYKSFVTESKFASVDAELQTLLRHAPTFRSLIEPNGNGPLAKLARTLSVFDLSTAHPLIFTAEASSASEEEKAVVYDLIISYVVRRVLCGLTPKNYNNVFLRITSHMRANGVSRVTCSEAFAQSSGDAVRFPDDTELRKQILERKQYGNIHQTRLRYILNELEMAARGRFDEAAGIRDDLTIEHVLPDIWAEHWPLSDGTVVPPDLRTGLSDAQLKEVADREALKHSLGNLTLLTGSRNPSLGNLGFNAKHKAFEDSQLVLNHEIADVANWNEDSIRQRANRLADLAIAIWPGISVERELAVQNHDANVVPLQSQLGLILNDVPNFVHTWPDGKVEHFTQALEGTAVLNGRNYRIRLGTTIREAAGKLRRRFLIFVNSYPTVEFVARDDQSTPANVVSILKDRTGKQVQTDDGVPAEYANIEVAPYRSVVDGPSASNGAAVICKSTDFETMVKHALIRTSYREQRA
jgi:hypothetical protein